MHSRTLNWLCRNFPPYDSALTVLKSSNYDDRCSPCNLLVSHAHSSAASAIVSQCCCHWQPLTCHLVHCSGFDEYRDNCKQLDMAGWIVFDAEDGDSPAPGKRKDSSRRGSSDRGDRNRSTWTQQHSALHEAAPSGVGGMRGSARPRDRGTDREQISSVRGRPERYSRDLR